MSDEPLRLLRAMGAAIPMGAVEASDERWTTTERIAIRRRVALEARDSAGQSTVAKTRDAYLELSSRMTALAEKAEPAKNAKAATGPLGWLRRALWS